jgi:hypothetical protein
MNRILKIYKKVLKDFRIKDEISKIIEILKMKVLKYNKKM